MPLSGDSKAVKIALPQDEYDQTARLDDWLASWRVDLIYSVCYAHRDVFYLKASQHAEIVEGLTGYIDDADIAMMRRFARPFADREIDVGYRARNLPPYFGRFSRLKAEIGERFLAPAQGFGLRVDISLDPKDVLVGDDWLKFLGNCRFTLGCESGSSLLDPRGEIRAACGAYLREHPEAGFDEVEAACFPGQDMQRIFSAISPRLFEAALAGSCQVLVPGHYLGVLHPDEHYIPLAADFSNIAAVLDELRDWRRAGQRAEACRKVLLGDQRLSYRGFVADLLQRIENRLDARGLAVQPVAMPESAAEAAHELAAFVVRTAVNRASDLQEVRVTTLIAQENVTKEIARLNALLSNPPARLLGRMILTKLRAHVSRCIKQVSGVTGPVRPPLIRFREGVGALLMRIAPEIRHVSGAIKRSGRRWFS
jgi:hypothetical protein